MPGFGLEGAQQERVLVFLFFLMLLGSWVPVFNLQNNSLSYCCPGEGVCL